MATCTMKLVDMRPSALDPSATVLSYQATGGDLLSTVYTDGVLRLTVQSTYAANLTVGASYVLTLPT